MRRRRKRPIDEALTRSIVVAVAENMIRQGIIDPRGKTDAQLRAELLRNLRRFSSETGDLPVVIAYDEGLLAAARGAHRRQDLPLACILYATWLEHRLNAIISIAGARRGIADEVQAQIMREVPLRGKTSWLPQLMGVRRIHERHANAVIQISEFRNQFVHYKWQAKTHDVRQDQEKALRRALGQIERTITYLQRYENEVVFFKSKSRVRRLLS